MKAIAALTLVTASVATASAALAQTSIPPTATEQMIGERIVRDSATCRELQLSVRRSATEELLGYDVRCQDISPSAPGEVSIPENATEQQLNQ